VGEPIRSGRPRGWQPAPPRRAGPPGSGLTSKYQSNIF
jgi:hypothetical protein